MGESETMCSDVINGRGEGAQRLVGEVKQCALS